MPTRLPVASAAAVLLAASVWIVHAAVIPDTPPVAPGSQAVAPPPAPPPPPTCDLPAHRQFDFWVGEWDVRPAGTPETAPTPFANVIRLEDSGCVVTEHWTTPRMTGRSVNIYDRTRGQWHQTWVDSTGGLHEYWGQANADGDLVFMGSTPTGTNDNSRQTVRLSFFNLGPDKTRPGKVRQFSEVLAADGRWTTNYDLIYYRRVPSR